MDQMKETVEQMDDEMRTALLMSSEGFSIREDESTPPLSMYDWTEVDDEEIQVNVTIRSDRNDNLSTT
jgi:hypothetical protein